ncbi:DNA-directed RNA polymerase subunit beta', partial [Phtheirospermum japonicum]
FSLARPITKKPTFFRLRGLFEYKIQSLKYSIPLFFYYPGALIYFAIEKSLMVQVLFEKKWDAVFQRLDFVFE